MCLPDFETLLAACQSGGAVALTCNTDLQPAAGQHGVIAAARYVSGNTPTYAYETRYIDGEALRCVTIDSKQSHLNRCEQGMAMDIEEGNTPLSQTPRIRVWYGDTQLNDYELPHRAFDGHIRAGTVDGKPVTENTRFVQARNATPANMRALLELSPTSLTFGVWDASRSHHQVRVRSALVGEITGVLADQQQQQIDNRGAARCDDFSPSVKISQADMKELVQPQRHELSSGNLAKIDAEIKAGKAKPISGASLGLGSIPPSLDALGFVACRRIIRSSVLSFSALRQLRFGAGPDGDAACRALLAALGLAGLVRANNELYLRANCDLVEKSAPVWILDKRAGKSETFIDDDPSATVTEADDLLQAAIDNAVSTAGITWEGQVFEVTGNPLISANTDATAPDDAAKGRD